MDRTKVVEQQFFNLLAEHRPVPRDVKTDPQLLKTIYRSMVQSRLLDYQGRKLKALDQGFYTIGSAGHEANAVFGALLQKRDPCLLHYRSGALMIARADAHDYPNMIYDTLLSFCASKQDPTSGGRHKVWGNKQLWVPPQTSTIASHLPKAVGMAFAIGRSQKFDVPVDVAKDSLVLTSFGDASCNHASAQTAFNAASWSAYQKLPTPVLFLCEDNGLGISVRTPQGWIASQMQVRPDITYFYADGSDIDQLVQSAHKAIEYCRGKQKPVFFHLKTVRLFGHAGSDVETSYRKLSEIEAMEASDPLLTNAKLLIDARLLSGEQIAQIYQQEKSNIEALAIQARQTTQITSAAEVVRPLHYQQEISPAPKVNATLRSAHFEHALGFLPEQSPKQRHLAMLLNWALQDVMLRYSTSVLFGEDVGRKGGVYHVTHDLQKQFGSSRVFNTLLDETTILGLAIGMAQMGFLPIAEIQYLAYYHNAQDQIRSEAASQSFFSNGQFTNPMVLRIASYAYQKGFGGHFHNDNSLAALLDVPGLMILSPSRGDDAASMLQHALYCAHSLGRVVVFLEPIALYMQKDLHAAGDGKWLCDYPVEIDISSAIEPKQYHKKNKDLLVITYANGVHMSLQAAQIIKEQHGLHASVLDVRQLKPLSVDTIKKVAGGYDQILFVDECRTWGGVSDRILAELIQSGECRKKTFQTVQAHDTYIPLGPAANLVLPQVADIVDKAIEMVGTK